MENDKLETLEEAKKRFANSGIWQCPDSFEIGAKWQAERLYTEEDMIKASRYGYDFHKTTQFPDQEFDDSCINNTKQWLTLFNKK